MGAGVDETVTGVEEGSTVVEESTAVELEEPTTAVYKLNLLPEPQYSDGFPAQVILHCVTTTSAEPTPRVFPHQHSLPYSRPAYAYPAHSPRHVFTSIVSEP